MAILMCLILEIQKQHAFHGWTRKRAIRSACLSKFEHLNRQNLTLWVIERIGKRANAHIAFDRMFRKVVG